MHISRDCISRYLKDRQSYGKRKKNPRNSKVWPAATRRLGNEDEKGIMSAAQFKYQMKLTIQKRRVQQIFSSIEHLQIKKFKKTPPLTRFHIELGSVLLENTMRGIVSSGNVWYSEMKKLNLGGADSVSCYFHDLKRDGRVLSRRDSGDGGVMICEAFAKCSVWTLAFTL